MRIALDAGAFIGFERNDRRATDLVREAQLDRVALVTHGGIVGQVYRSPHQVGLVRLLRGVEIVPIGLGLGRDAGRLLAASRTSDVLDAAIVALLDHGDTIVTSDPGDIGALVVAAQVDATILAL